MLRISKLADYAVRIMVFFAESKRSPITAQECAEALHISLPTVRKVLKCLHQSQLLGSQLGVKGGYQLARTAKQVSVAEVIAAMDGPLALTECAEPGEHCHHQHACSLRNHWQVINGVVDRALRALSLADMCAGHLNQLFMKLPQVI
jgi:FeS assembly SUF system regulator